MIDDTNDTMNDPMGFTAYADAPIVFPSERWHDDRVTFTSAEREPNAPCAAVLLFPFYGDRVVLANIAERGWSIPAGGVETGETPQEAMRREAQEEAGLTIGRLFCIGYYTLDGTGDGTGGGGTVRLCPTYIGEVQHIGDWTDKEESLAVQMFNIEDVADLYYRWDALLAAVFAHAEHERRRLLTVGVSLTAFTEGELR